MADEEVPIPKSIAKYFYLLLFIVGGLFYIYWRFKYYSLSLTDMNSWYDPGLYTITVVLMGFGLIGTILYSTKSKNAN